MPLYYVYPYIEVITDDDRHIMVFTKCIIQCLTPTFSPSRKVKHDAKNKKDNSVSLDPLSTVVQNPLYDADDDADRAYEY